MDPLFRVTAENPTASAEDSSIQLPTAPKHMNNQIYLTTEALEALWKTDVSWDSLNKKVVIRSIDDSDIPDGEMAQVSLDGVQTQGAQTFKIANINKQKLVQTALRYKGVPYRFGAGHYSKTRRFDCSSFTQYIYSKVGVSLPRTSRAQSKKGYRVSINNLKPGDLLFFYTPGRYRSNRIVGHVGMYIGNGKMIHTYGKPGVTVDSIQGYWKSRFLFAKRVA